MLSQIEGSQAVAETVARCRPEVIAAYPISPQTHIVETLSAIVQSGRLARCEYVNVESEFAAMSVCIGASATGARTYTATASQGLLFVAEALYNASGLGLPIVMTDAIPRLADQFEAAFGRRSGGLLRSYRTEDADTVVLALGSVLGTIEDVVDELREQGVRIGAVGLKCFRPYPLDEVREALSGAAR